MFSKPDTVKRLPPRLHDVLKAIYEYTEENGRAPYRNNRVLSEKLPTRSTNDITNCKRLLIDGRYLTEELELASKGIDYVRHYFTRALSVRGVRLLLQGEVRASPGDVDAFANYEEFDRPSDTFIVVPEVPSEQDVFALRVTGPSMEEIGIFDGDYVIVEIRDGWWPQPQQLIVTRYLPHNPKRSLDDHVEESEFVGPVLKIYFHRFSEQGAELGWKRRNEQNPYIIKADRLKPIGNVIGVYRDQKNLNSRLPSYPLPADSI